MGMGAQIRKLRKQKGLSQMQLGSMIGAEANTVSRWEKDKIEASHGYIVKLADALETTTDYLLGREKHSPDVGVVKQQTPISPPGPTKRPVPRALIYEQDGRRLVLPDTPENHALFVSLVEKVINRAPSRTPSIGHFLHSQRKVKKNIKGY